ncbi:MAG: hypothetical protein AB7L71_07355 [Vicinamibacterales bacterium]
MTVWRHARHLAGLCAALALDSGPVRGQGLPSVATEEIGKVVQAGIAREFTTCKLQNAVWGGYDVRVHITMGIDGLPHLFEMRSGRFSRVVDPEPMPGPNRFERTGRLAAESAEQAFAKGMPFYVSAAELLAPDRLAVTVVSNPAVRVESATLLVLVDQPGAEDLTSVTLPLASSPAPQRLLAVHAALRTPTLVRLAVLRDVDNTALMMGCVLSNEVDVRPAL